MQNNLNMWNEALNIYEININVKETALTVAKYAQRINVLKKNQAMQ